jgi:hypothetical protein
MVTLLGQLSNSATRRVLRELQDGIKRSEGQSLCPAISRNNPRYSYLTSVHLRRSYVKRDPMYYGGRVMTATQYFPKLTDVAFARRGMSERMKARLVARYEGNAWSLLEQPRRCNPTVGTVAAVVVIVLLGLIFTLRLSSDVGKHVAKATGQKTWWHKVEVSLMRRMVTVVVESSSGPTSGLTSGPRSRKGSAASAAPEPQGRERLPS